MCMDVCGMCGGSYVYGWFFGGSYINGRVLKTIFFEPIRPTFFEIDGLLSTLNHLICEGSEHRLNILITRTK